MLVNVVVDAASPVRLAEFWSRMLTGWWVREEPEGEIDVVAPESDGATLDLVFVPVAEPKRGKNRLHLDLASDSPRHQAELVERALSAGGRRVDIGQGDVPWVVLEDPEGNEFCVLEPRDAYADTGRMAAIVLDSNDPAALAPFWSSATGWEVVRAEPHLASLRAPQGRGPWLELLRTNDAKVTKNRVHLDVGGDDGLVERVRALGAVTADVGQGDAPWVVLQDPQGNEFCVLPRP
jgi:hypothetical protein